MTIAISIKVNDGVVLATDSASTMMAQDMQGNIGVINIYDNANKLLNIHKDLPVGIITWGAGSIGTASITTIIKNFREEITKNNIEIDIDSYTVSEIAILFKNYILEIYNEEFKDWPQKPDVGFIIAGYSSNKIAEEQMIQFVDGNVIGPNLLREEGLCGITWQGQPEAITRLVSGAHPFLEQIIGNSRLVSPENIIPLTQTIYSNSRAELVSPAMPIKDAIDLAEFLVELTEKFVRFSPGAKTVGGPIEIASITAHEGFKWIKRKHYYSKDIN
ncbi:hypothetical protein I3900191A7_14800 [Clostridium baratii]|uniref:hypothetical protein n=1 Tax=Clostridium baratii TaxID=1561 RepID=UPI0036F1B15D